MESFSTQEKAYHLLSRGRYEELIEVITPRVKDKDSWAEAILGQCYQMGWGVEQDHAAAKHFFELSAAQNNSQGRLLLGHHLLLEGEIDRGRQELESAFEAGVSSAASYLAQSFFSESEDPGSIGFEAGLAWLEKSAESGDTESMHSLAWLFGERGDEESLADALGWYERAAELGSANSALNAGIAHSNGRGTAVDHSRARHFYAIAAEAGISTALHNLAVLFLAGKGGSVDKEGAFKCFNAAAQQGSFLSSQSIAKMIAAGDIPNIPPNQPLQLAWLMIGEAQAEELGHVESSILDQRKRLMRDMHEDEKVHAISALEAIGESNPRWVARILAKHYATGELVTPDENKAAFWKTKIIEASPVAESDVRHFSTDTDLASLPQSTSDFVGWLAKLGLDEQQIHGLFVLLGLYVGTPRPKEEAEQLMARLMQVLPHERNVFVDNLVSDFFEGFEQPLEEFCFRAGIDYEFRSFSVAEDMAPLQVLTPRNHGLLAPDVVSLENLADTSRLFQSLLIALGECTFCKKRSLKEAFFAGVFQMQNIAVVDKRAARQLSYLLSTSTPLAVGHGFDALRQNTIEYSLNLRSEQACIHRLMLGVSPSYAKQMWAFQSALFFHDEKPISDVSALDPSAWHRWVIDRTKLFGEAYPTQLLGFSQSGQNLVGVPAWDGEINNFDACDQFINYVWGFSANSLRNNMELLEFKALMAYLVYASLTLSRETIQ